MTRQPAIFLSHGGGPCFWVDWPAPFGPGAFDGLRDYLAGLVARLPERPKAFLVISAHWEAEIPTVSTAAAPAMLYDYYGFPPLAYQLTYPAPGAPDIAARARQLLEDAGIASAEDPARGFDHGVFVPFLIADPEASIPVVMVSMRADLDPGFHIRMGEKLESLRDEGVCIVGSGMSYHDLASFRDGDGRASAAFDTWLAEAVHDRPADQRNAALMNWEAAPAARACHPREDHLIPLMAVAGAAGADRGQRAFHDIIGGKHISGFEFGDIAPPRAG